MFRRSILFALALGSATGIAVAHEKGALFLSTKEVTAGSNLGIRGERMPKNGSVTLQLRGTLETFALGEVKADSAGKFSMSTGLPAEARAGSYMVTAVASDSEKIAEAALVIVAAAPSAEHEMAGHGPPNVAAESTAMPHATAENMPVQTSTGGAEWAVIGALIGASLAGGVMLLRKRG